ncbi:uncharacterized protein LOC121645169 isoform X2 [Melanotaenia boesemani]|uniref:uncharacterized protein LOC121645169 isoform X2 n=1 Tax=Melanotaenia boesemani TaxID=1250792 RepID=UPI001C05C13F|nr:uncharacterized protein LOC121645169 isoform X2 [Melanotaenia boesemani]
MGGETTDEEGEGANSCKPPARKKRYTRYNPHWATLSEFEWVRPTQEDHFSATCVLCPAKISVKYEFKAFMEGQHELLKAAKGDSKYTWKKRRWQQQAKESIQIKCSRLDNICVRETTWFTTKRRWQQQAKGLQIKSSRFKNICVRETVCVKKKAKCVGMAAQLGRLKYRVTHQNYQLISTLFCLAVSIVYERF